MLDLVHHKQAIQVSQRTYPIPNDRIRICLAKLSQDVEFETVKELGEGNYSFVRLCRRKTSVLTNEKQLLAVKYCLVTRISNWVKLEKRKIPLEAAVLCTLEHPNIANLISHQNDDFFFILVFPWLPCMVDLFEFSTTRAYGEGCIRFIIKQVLDAVNYMHQQGVVHRDIKDENVLIDKENRIKIIDFGSAAFIDMGPFDSYQGTSHFEAPEIVRTEIYSGPPQDIWQIGVLLYMLLHGRAPFETDQDILNCQFQCDAVYSDSCNKFLATLFVPDASKRPTATEAMNHEWLQTVQI